MLSFFKNHLLLFIPFFEKKRSFSTFKSHYWKYEIIVPIKFARFSMIISHINVL